MKDERTDGRAGDFAAESQVKVLSHSLLHKSHFGLLISFCVFFFFFSIMGFEPRHGGLTPPQLMLATEKTQKSMT